MPPPTPSRWATVGVVLWVLVLTCGLLFGAGLDRRLFILGIAVLQLALIVGFVILRRPSGPLVTGGVAVFAAAGADLVVVYSDPFTPGNVIFILAGAFGLSVVGQLFRPGRRTDLSVSLGVNSYLAILALSLSAYLALLRHPGGLQALWVCVIAAGVAVLAARAVDLTIPNPRINRQVPRGAFGIVIGGMVGTAAAAYSGVLLDGPTPEKAALGGLVIGLVAVLGDLSIGFFHAGRRIAGDGMAPWPVRHGLGPLVALAIVAPLVYLLSVYYIVRGF